MSEKQKEVLATIMEAVPNLSDFQKGRLYGIAETMEEKNRKEDGKNDGTSADKASGAGDGDLHGSAALDDGNEKD